jgi:hypothetical protein
MLSSLTNAYRHLKQVSTLEADTRAMDDAMFNLFNDLDENEDGKITGKEEIYYIFDSLR